MASREGHNEEEKTRLLMRELRTKQNARFLQKMPAFKLDDRLPAAMRSLLDRLDQAEHGNVGGCQAGAFGAAHGPER